jgi:hypothetical protein
VLERRFSLRQSRHAFAQGAARQHLEHRIHVWSCRAGLSHV